MAIFEVIKGSGGAGTGYATIEGNGVAVPQETTINFIGTGVTVTDNALNSRTDVTITGGTFNQTIEGQGVAKPQEPILNFASAIFTVTDNPGNTSTDITITTPISIALGGSGQATKTLAFDALSPLTTKGDLIASNGTDNIRVGVGTNGQVLQADSTATGGVSWTTNPAGAYDTIDNAGTPLTQRTILNFSGSGITAVDNGGATRTDVSLAATLVDVAGLTPTSNSLIFGNSAGTHFTNAVLIQQQTIFVALNGSDTTGNGSILFPYRTLAHANSVITDAANLKKYTVAFMGGRFDESVNIVLKPYVSYWGYGSSFSYITSPNNIIAPDASYNNANGRTSISNLYIGGSTGINWDLTGLGTTGSAVLDLVGVQINGGLTYKGRNNGADFLQTEGGTYWLGNTQLSNCQISIYGGFSGGSFTYDTAASTGHNIGTIFGFQFNGAVSLTTTAGITMALSIQESPTSTNTLSISGATTTISIDNNSLPTLASNYTVSGGASVTLLTSDYGITSTYVPINYTPTASTVDGNFHGIDNALATLNPFHWNAVAGTSQTLAVNNGYQANSSSLTTFTLPTVAAFGSIIEVAGYGTGLYVIAQNAGQVIHDGTVNTTVGVTGSIASTVRYDAIKLMCSVANTEFTVLRDKGNFNVT